MKRKNDTHPARVLPTWAVMLIVIAVFDLFLVFEYLCVVKIPSPVGAFCGLLVIVNLLIWGILSVAFSERGSSVSVIGEKELRNAMRLLRYATAILSFLSLMTTANGMKSFVFDTDWKAYLGSFAVQSILVVFSLLLCHFYVMVGTLPNFGKAAKALMLGALTLFFAAALVVSSCFSYVYISGNAYKDAWLGDRETLIQEYLIRETAELKERNTLLGKLFLENIGGDIQKTLEGEVKSYLEEKEGKASEEMSNFRLEEYTNAQDDLNKIDITGAVERLNRDKRAHPEQLGGIQDAYNTIGLGELRQAFEDYENVLKLSSIPANSDIDIEKATLEEMSGKLSTISEKLQEIIDRVDYAINGVNELSTSYYIKDIKPIKLTFESAATKFKDFVQRQKENLDDLIAKADATGSGTASSGQLSVTDQIKAIRRQIYLLNPQQPDLDSATQDIVGSLSELLDRLSKSDAVSTESVALLTSLVERISQYGKSLKLSNHIQGFLEIDLGKMYSFAENEEGSEDEWRSVRDDDFREFLSMLHDLPDPSSLDETYRGKYKKGGEEKGEEYRDTANVLKETESIRRDLLGNLTVFEESLTYFKYDFRKMAIFSAFVAIFLDLGAFLTGCFLYSARHIQPGKAEVSQEEPGTEPEPELEPESEREKAASRQ